MKFFLRTVFLSILVSLLLLDTFAQTPSVQWVNVVSGQKDKLHRGMQSIAVKDGLITLTDLWVSTYLYYQILYKHGLDGLEKESYFYSCRGGNTGCYRFKIVPNQGGYLVYFNPTKFNTELNFLPAYIEYYNDGKTQWSYEKMSGFIPNPATKPNGGYYTVAADTLGWYKVNSFSNKGALLKTQEYARLSKRYLFIDYKTTVANGLLITNSNNTTKLDSNLVTQWSTGFQGDSIIVLNDTHFLARNANGISKFRIDNGDLLWTFAQTGIKSFQATADFGCVLLTNDKLIRLNADGSSTFTDTAPQQVLCGTDSSLIILKRMPAQITKLTKNNTIKWTYDVPKMNNPNEYGGYLTIQLAPDNGIYLTGQKNTSLGSLYNTVSYVSKLSSDLQPCDYKVSVVSSKGNQSTYCKTFKSDTLRVRIGNYTLDTSSNYALSNNFKIQWKRNKIAIPNATNITYITTESGSYEVTVSQGENCSVTSSPFTIDVLNAFQPSITASINPVCEGVATTLTSTCSSDANVWSTGEKTSTLTFTPKTASTAITVYCAEKYSVGDSIKTCIGTSSEPYIVTSYSNNLGVKITGNTIVCGTKPTLLGTTITGGKSPYQYNWKQNLKTLSQSNQLSISDGGTYTLSVLDQGGCTASSDIAILKSSPSVSLKGNTSFCSGTSMNLNAETTGGFPDYTLSWRKDRVAIGNTTNLLNVTTGGSYAVTVTDSKGCQSADSLTITEKAKDLIAQINVGATSAFYPNSVVLKATTGVNFIYQWMKDNLPILNETYNSYTAKETGVFNVIVSKEGCSQSSQPISIYISIPLATEKNLEESGIHIGPNPTSTQLNIAVNLPESDNVIIQVVDVKGQSIIEQKSSHKLSTHEIIIDTSQWSDGVYFLKIQSSKNQTIRKIIKQ